MADQQRLSKSANIEKLSQVRAILRLMGWNNHQLRKNFIIKMKNLTMIKEFVQKH